MSLFNRNEVAAAAPVYSGTDELRRALRARDSKAGGLKAISRDIEGLGLEHLANFTAGRSDLTTAHKMALTMILFPGAEYDVETGLLKMIRKETTQPRRPAAAVRSVNQPPPAVRSERADARAAADQSCAEAEDGLKAGLDSVRR